MLGLVLASCWRTRGEMEQQALALLSLQEPAGGLRGSVCSSSAAPGSGDGGGLGQTSPQGGAGAIPAPPQLTPAPVSQGSAGCPGKMQFCGYLWVSTGFQGAPWGPCVPHTEQVLVTACQEVRKGNGTRVTRSDISSANPPCACAASLGGLSQFLTRYKTFSNEISRWPYKSKASYPAPCN